MLLEPARQIPGGKLRPKEVKCLAYSHVVRRLRTSKKLSFPRHAEAPLLCPPDLAVNRNYSLVSERSSGVSGVGSGQWQR